MKFVLCVERDKSGKKYFGKGINPISNKEGYYLVPVVEEDVNKSKFNFIKQGAARIVSKEWVLENKDRLLNVRVSGDRLYQKESEFSDFIEKYEGIHHTLFYWGCYAQSIEYIPSGKNLVYTFNAPSLYDGVLPYGRGVERVDIRLSVDLVINGNVKEIGAFVKEQQIDTQAFVERKVKELDEQGCKGYKIRELKDTVKNMNLHIAFIGEQIARLKL